MALNCIPVLKKKIMQMLISIPSIKKLPLLFATKQTNYYNLPDPLMPASPFSARRFLITFSIAWLVLMAEHVILLNWYDLQLKVAIVDSVISNIPLLGVCLLVMNTIRYYLPGREQYMNILVMCIVLTILWLLLSKWLLGLSLNSFEGYEEFLHRSLIIRFSIGFLV